MTPLGCINKAHCVCWVNRQRRLIEVEPAFHVTLMEATLLTFNSSFQILFVWVFHSFPSGSGCKVRSLFLTHDRELKYESFCNWLLNNQLNAINQFKLSGGERRAFSSSPRSSRSSRRTSIYKINSFGFVVLLPQIHQLRMWHRSLNL